MAAELVNVPFELMAMEPFEVVAVKAVDTVTLPPLIVIGPAIEVALAKVIAAVFVADPTVRADEFEAIVKLAVDTAAPNEVAPVGGSSVFEPVPASSKAVKLGLKSCRAIAPLVETLAVVSWMIVNPAAVPVFTVMSPEVLETSAPIQ
jgi:hypothetical protein